MKELRTMPTPKFAGLAIGLLVCLAPAVTQAAIKYE